MTFLRFYSDPECKATDIFMDEVFSHDRYDMEIKRREVLLTGKIGNGKGNLQLRASFRIIKIP